MTDFGFPLLFDAAVKGTLVLLGAAGLALVLRRGSAASRHLIWQMAVLAILLLPLVKAFSPLRFAVLPALRSPIAAAPAAPASNPDLTSKSTIEKQSAAPATQPPAQVGAAPTQGQSLPLRALTWLAIVWLLVAAVLLMRLALGFVLVRWFALRAYPLYEEGWAE